MDGGLWIDVASEAQGARLAGALPGFVTEAGRDNGTHVLRVFVDSESALLLETLFGELGTWLAAEGLDACQVHFGERAYTLMQPSNGHPADPREFLLERTIQLQTALESRVVIEQAKGIIAGMLDIDCDDAFELLRATARRTRRDIHDTAAEIVARRSVPSSVREHATAE